MVRGRRRCSASACSRTINMLPVYAIKQAVRRKGARTYLFLHMIRLEPGGSAAGGADCAPFFFAMTVV